MMNYLSIKLVSNLFHCDVCSVISGVWLLVFSHWIEFHGRLASVEKDEREIIFYKKLLNLLQPPKCAKCCHMWGVQEAAAEVLVLCVCLAGREFVPGTWWPPPMGGQHFLRARPSVCLVPALRSCTHLLSRMCKPPKLFPQISSMYVTFRNVKSVYIPHFIRKRKCRKL